MAERLRPRGWYPDPADPTLVRHWDGQGWPRSRNRPAWSLATGELVVDPRGAADPSRPGGPPVIEGPVRPAPERATTSALGAAERRPKSARPTSLRSTSAHTGPRAGQFAPAGSSLGPAAGRPWAGSRRPVAILSLVVVGAVVALVALVGLTGPARIDPGPLPSGFVTQASTDCTHTLGDRPTALPDDPLAIGAQDAQLSDLGGELRHLAVTDGGSFQANGWLSQWQTFTQAEQARAAALTKDEDASTLTLAADDAAANADHFADANGVASCSILASAPAALQAVPS